MAKDWQTTSYPGVRFYSHPTRKNGVQKDRNFCIRYRFKDQEKGVNIRKEEMIGWASEGWTIQKAAKELAELKKNHLTGEGPQTLSEKRQLNKQLREESQQEAEQLEREKITFREYFESEYLPNARETKKPESVRKEQEHVKNWIGPATDNLPLKELKALHLERIRSNMLNGKCAVRSKRVKVKKRSPRSIEYVFATFRSVWNHARDRGVVTTGSPSKQVNRPRVNNQRQRFLSRAEADLLLKQIAESSQQTHDICLLSLHTGMRFSEIASLTWGCVDTTGGRIQILNAKGAKDRTAFMRREVKEMFALLDLCKNNELVFKSRTGGRIGKISKAFDKAVVDIGLNQDITDPKQKFSFHCLRHTFASWLAEEGESLQVVQKLLGHSTPIMTQRYSHLGDNTLERAVLNFDKSKTDSR
ncbi:MAG: site-specific integrase [Desulfobacterales bacterium]|nr:site-specific integrase [Desulfobacterales bacterium]MDD4071393.1 site-specific integrase [Desulfobacterales bacterium]MDD4391438.1 site-specific integrase [Desulfobacterales bacterium]